MAGSGAKPTKGKWITIVVCYLALLWVIATVGSGVTSVLTDVVLALVLLGVMYWAYLRMGPPQS